MGEDEKIMNAESLNIGATLEQVSGELEKGNPLVLDVGNNYFHQTDAIYDSLAARGYSVKKSFRNGRNQVIVSKGE